eukprot:11585046-Alexandrium_andersonii.AAC.1
MSDHGATRVDLRRRAVLRLRGRPTRSWLSSRASRLEAGRYKRTTASAAETNRAAARAATVATRPAH